MNNPLLITLAALALLTGCSERKAEQAPAATSNEPVMVPSNEPEPGPVVMEFDKTQLRREITIAVLSIQSIRDAWELVEAMTQGGKRKSKHLVEMMDALPDFSKGDLSGSGSDCSLTEIRRLIESGQTRAASAKWRSRLAYMASQLKDYTIPDALSGSVKVGEDTYVYECDSTGRVFHLTDDEGFNDFV
ncbi:MAG: hypothetical protein D8B51_08145, partial [Tannerella sp.]